MLDRITAPKTKETEKVSYIEPEVRTLSNGMKILGFNIGSQEVIQLEFNFGNLVVLFSVWITSQSWRFKLFRIWANCIQSFLLSNLNIIIEIQVYRILWDLTQPQLSVVHDSFRGYLSIPWLFIDGRLIIVQELQKLTIFLGFLSKVVFLCTISFEWLLVLQHHTCCPSYFLLACLKFIRSWLSL